MNPRNHIPAAACLAVMLTSLFLPGTVAGQYPYTQPLYMAPTVQTNFFGAFYLTGGVKVRNIQTTRFTVVPHTPVRIDPGAPAWGPNEPGTVLYPYDLGAGLPTGTAGTSPTTSGIWNYDDGWVDARDPGVPAISQAYGPPILALGHYIAGAAAGASVGSFNVQDPLFQTDTGGGVYSSTSTVNMTKMLTGFIDPGTGVATAGFETESRVFTAISPEGPTLEFTNKVWAPYFEFGFQYSSYFDWFSGVSWYNLSNFYGGRRPVELEFGRRAYTDTFQFESGDGTNTWIGNFNSAFPDTSTNPAPGSSYVIFPIGRAAGRERPTRTFSIVADPTVITPIPAMEALYNRLDYSAVEFRGGGRSWIPLYGLGRFGVSVGGLSTPMWYSVVATDIVWPTADIVNMSGTVLVPAGTILISDANVLQNELTWNFGLFGGLDWEVGYNRFFLKTTVEYNWYLYSGLQYGQPIYNQVDLSGASLAFSLGGRF